MDPSERRVPPSSVRAPNSVLSSRPLSSAPRPLAELVEERAVAADGAYRSGAFGLALLFAFVALAAAPALPSVRAALHLGWRDVTSLLLPVLAAHGAATLLHRRAGPRAPSYRAFDLVESMAWLAAASTLVVRSGTAQSLFWLLHFAWIAVKAWGRDRLRDLGLLVLSCAGAIAAFALSGAREDAILAVGATGLALVVWSAQHALARKLAEADRERDGTQVLVVERKVQSERGRLARDLHDGLGAELSALVWRARALREEVSDEATQQELDRFVDRVRLGTDELRSIVWALRAPTEAWSDTVSYLRARCGELSGGEIDVAVQDGGAPKGMKLSGELRMQLVRIVQEAVRNAVRHARCARIDVSLGVTDAIRAKVVDDGQGIPAAALAESKGGLANIRERARRAGGEAVIRSEGRGTTVEVRLPLPKRRAERDERAQKAP
jgi:signal transduction histidine kinase